MPGPFVHRLRVRYSECDAQGIVFNANHFAYFDLVLTELWREAFGSYQALLDADADLVVAEASATFSAPARFDDELDIALRISALGRSSMTSALEERRDGDLLVSGTLVHVFVDPATLRSQPIPDDVRERLAPWVVSA